MYQDLQLMFVEKLPLQDVSSGVLGDILDLGAPGQGKGRQSFIAIVCGDDTTATGDPDISFDLETSETKDFLVSKKIPLSFPPLKKADLAAGKGLYAPTPLYLERYVRLELTTSSALTCAEFSAGFTLDPQTNG